MPGNPEQQQPAQAEDQRQLVYAAISDTEDTIRATDTKASIALVLHGFLFAGLLTTTLELGTEFESASSWFKAFAVSLLALTGIAFTVSVGQLLRCVIPAPKSVIPDDANTKDVFFLKAKVGVISGRVQDLPSGVQLAEAVASLTESQLSAEIAGEHVKVSAIRARKVALTDNGLRWLAIELVPALVFLGTIGIHALA